MDGKRFSDDPTTKKHKWINRQRVLVLATRSVSHQHRHLMKDIEKLMPHSRHGNKMQKKDNLFDINEMCALRNCNKCILFDGRLRRDLYIWISEVPHGPSAKFLVENIYTSHELKLSGNCLRGSRTLLSFDNSFIEHAHYRVLQELFTQTFGVPHHHPKSQPFIDRTLIFSVLDNKIWCRNYQIINEDGAIAEIGPRIVLQPIKIFTGSFCGTTLWENRHFTTPSRIRHLLMKMKKERKHSHKKEQKIRRKRNDMESVTDENNLYAENTLHIAAQLTRKLCHQS